MPQKKNTWNAYESVTQIARGTYTTLYRGVSPLSQKQIVIKVWPTADLADPGAFVAIQQEVGKLQQVKHPHILPILDVERSQQEVGLISPYIPGGSLQKLFQQRRGPLPLASALAIMKQVGQALALAHQNGIVHGNLTLHSILVLKEDTVALTDFRIKSILATIKTYTGNNSPALYKYAAPEYFQGESTEKTDQYALACLCYELLTGQPPFSGSARMTLKQKHLNEEPILPSTLNKVIPSYVENALMRALAKDPMERHQDIQTFLQALFGMDTAEVGASGALLVSPDASTESESAKRQTEPVQSHEAARNVQLVGWGFQKFKWRVAKRGKLAPPVLFSALLALLVLVVVLSTLLFHSTLPSSLKKAGSFVVQTPMATTQVPTIIGPTATRPGVTPTIQPSPTPSPALSIPTRAAVIAKLPTPASTVPAIPTPTPVNVPTPTPTVEPTPTAQPTQAPPEGVSPVLECIAPQANGAYLAKFGYLNPYSDNVTIPRGAGNVLYPLTYDGLQPTNFVPGRQQAILQVNVQSGTITWMLNGSTVTAGPDSNQC